MRILSADSRGGVSLKNELTERAVNALSQTHAVTFLDLPRITIAEKHELLNWCDYLLLVTHPSPQGIKMTKNIIEKLEGKHQLIPVVNMVSGGAHAASVALEIGNDNVMPVRKSKGIIEDSMRNCQIIYRKRSGTTKDINKILRKCLTIAS